MDDQDPTPLHPSKPDVSLGEGVTTYEAVTVQGDAMRFHLPAEVIGGLVASLEDRGGVLAVGIGKGLLMGLSPRMACAKMGFGIDQYKEWLRRDKEVSRLFERCSAFGFGGVFESELYARALAGGEDKGSMRALEMVVKANAPEYREKTQVEFTLLTKADDARDSMWGDWQNGSG